MYLVQLIGDILIRMADFGVGTLEYWRQWFDVTY